MHYYSNVSSESSKVLKLAEEKASMGLLYQKQGKLEAAISLYQEALTLVPDFHYIQYNLGIAFQHQGNLSAAYIYYQQAIAHHPQHIQAYYNIGIVLQQQGLLERAIFSYQKVINLSKGNAENILIQVQAYSNWGNILVKEGRAKEAIEIFQKAITLKSDDASLYNNQGQAFFELGKVEKAIINYRQALALKPQLIVASHNLGKVYQQQGLHSEAIVCFQEIINQYPENLSAHSNCAFSLLELGKLAAAIPHLQKVISHNSFVESYCEKASLLTESDELEKAKIACARFLVTLEEGRRKKEEGRRKKCIETQIQTNFQHPVGDEILNSQEIDELYLAEEVRIQKSKVKNKKEEGRRKKCIETQIQTNFQHPVGDEILNSQEIDELYLAEVRENLVLTYSSLGNVLFEYGEYSQAENYYQKALQLQPLNVELHLKLGNSLSKQKRFNTAIIIYHLGLAVEPDNYAISQALEEGRRKKEERERTNLIGTQTLANDEVLNQKSKDKNDRIKCQGLNCQPCLKRIFKQLQPIHLGNGIYSLSREKTQTINIDFPETPKFVTEVVNGRAWIVPQKNNWMICNAVAIINEDNQLLTEVSREYPGQLPGCDKYDINNHRFFTTEELPPLEQINGTVAVLSGLSGNVYFHWMVDILPRIEILRRNDINFEQIDWFLINSTKQPFQKETLRVLGIPEDKIIESDRHPYIQAKKLIVPSFSSHLAWIEKWALEFHRQVFLNRSLSTVFKDGFKGKKNQHHLVTSYPERIYISRNKAKYRRVINEEKVIDLLSQYGFVTIELETLSVVEQVALFAHAKVIVAPHGSGLTNIMFCTPETTVIELVSPNYIKHYYWAIAQQLGLKYYYLVGEEFSYYPIRQIMYPNSLTEDIIINLSKLEKMLSQASIKKVNSHPVVKVLSEEQISQEKVLLEKKLSNEEDNVSRTVVSNKMASKVNPTEAATHFHKQALLYLDRKNLDEAKAACEQALKYQPNFAEACKTMGIIVQKEGQIEAAFEWYSRAINIQPDFAEAYVNIGTLSTRKHQWQNAIEYYQKAITIKPDLAPAHRNIAKAYQKVGKVVEAAIFQYKAYCLEPTKIKEKDYINLGNTLLKHQKLTEAISCYRSAIKLNPNSAVAYQNIAEALSQTGDVEESNTCYRKAIQLGIANFSNFNGNLGKKTSNLSTKNTEHKINSTIINQEKNNISVDRDNVENYKRLAKILQNQGKAAEAWQFYTKAVSIAPKDPEIYRDLGSLYGQQQKWQEAIQCYQKAIEICPNMADVNRYLATALTNVGQDAEASKFLEKAYVIEEGRSSATPRRQHTQAVIACNDDSHKQSEPGGVLNPKEKDNSDINHHIYSFTSDSTQKTDGEIDDTRVISSSLQLLGNTGTFQSPFKYFDRFFKQLFSSVLSVFNFYHQSLKKYLQPSKNIPRLQGTNNSFPLKPEIDFHLKDSTETADEILLFPVEVNLINTDGNEQQKVLIKNENNELDIIEKTFPKINRPQIESSNEIDTQINTQYVDVTKSAVVLPDVYIQRAIAYNQEGLYEKAIAECQQAIKVQPDMAMAYKILGNAQQKMGIASQLQEAKQSYLKAISLDSQDALIHGNLGSLYAQEELWEKAIPCYQEAIALKPDFAGAYRNLAKAWTQVGKQAEAADCCYEAYTLELANITPEQHLSLGNTLSRQGQLTKAISCYQRAIKLDPNYAAAYHNLAITLKRQGKLDRAAIYAQKAQEISNNSVKKQVKVNGNKTQYINPEDVLQSYSNSIEEGRRKEEEGRSGATPRRRQTQGNAHQERKNWMGTQTISNFQHSVDGRVLNPKEKDKKGKEKLPEINQADLIQQAEADFVNSKFYSAISTCEEAISIKPHAVAYQIMGKAWVEINKPDEAIAAYQKAIEIKPDFGEIHASLGELYAQNQRQKEAIIAYKKAIKFAPDLKDSYRGLVEILLDQGKVDEAEELSYNALIQHPSWATAQEFYTLGKGLIADNKIQQGVACFYQAIELDSKLLEAHYSLGKTLAEKGEWLEAISCYQQVIQLEANETEENYSESEINIDIGEIYHLLGDALQEIGKLDESVAAYQRAIELTGN